MEEHLDPSQCGNRRSRSTTHYLVNLVQFILTEAKRGNHANLLVIDYSKEPILSRLLDHSKAFDKVDINVALGKLLV